MTQEQKQLLLRNLCARLPYGVKCEDTNINVIGTLSQIGLHYDMCVLDKDDGNSESCYIPNCKPYLFPFSSITEEQKKEEYEICKYHLNGYESKLIDFYNKNHFDYRGLIEKELAIDATELNVY
jgi:hypothetical protein